MPTYTDHMSEFIKLKCICLHFCLHEMGIPNKTDGLTAWTFCEGCSDSTCVTQSVHRHGCSFEIEEMRAVCCNGVCVVSSSLTGRLSWENRPWTSLCPPSPTPPPPSSFWVRGTSTVFVTTARSASWRSWSSTPAASCPTPQVNQDTESLA